MKWNEQLTAKLKKLCYEGKTNAQIADIMRCKLADVYAKRSQLGITIAKCRGMAPNPDFEKAVRPIMPKGMRKSVRDAFEALDKALLLAIGSDWTSVEDAKLYYALGSELSDLKEKYNTRIRH